MKNNYCHRKLTIIQANAGQGVSRVAEILSVSDLILLFVKRDFVTLYKQTVLGPLWFVIQPLMMTIVFTVVFGKIAKIPTDGIPPFLFYLSGLVPWGYFSACLDKNSSIFVSNSGIFSKVYFPRLAVPIANVISNLIAFAVQFVTLILFILYFSYSGSTVSPNWLLAWIVPFLLLQMAMLGMGIGLIISSMTVKYRDLMIVVPFGIQLWMYATPIVYPLSEAGANLQFLLSFNPMTATIETFRYIFLGKGMINPLSILLSVTTSFSIFLIGIFLFWKSERNFIDTV